MDEIDSAIAMTGKDGAIIPAASSPMASTSAGVELRCGTVLCSTGLGWNLDFFRITHNNLRPAARVIS
jgi:hypothetical protein